MKKTVIRNGNSESYTNMKERSKMRRFFRRAADFFSAALEDYLSVAFWLLFAALLARLYEALLLTHYHGDFSSYVVWNSKGLFDDAFLFFKAGGVIFLLFAMIFAASRKGAQMALRLFWTMMLFLSLICVTFFAISGYFLDTIVFTYSFKEIFGVIRSSSGVPFWGYLTIFLLPILFFIFSKKRFRIFKPVKLIFLVCLTIFPFVAKPAASRGADFFVKENKGQFFLKSIFRRSKYIEIKQDVDYESVVNEFQEYFPQRQFLDPAYPFLHKADNEDVLSDFFILNDTPPNIVLVVCEGLSMEILDPEITIMPFLDSLSKTGLFWDHCYAISERTFGAFPALLGALPMGKKGFMSRSPYTPKNDALLKILNRNNYKTGFYYGGWYSFDNMEKFMGENQTPCKNLDWDKDIEKESIGAYWGKEDHLMFLQSLRRINFDECPRCDIYLTLSTHDPWEYPDAEKHQKKFVEIVAEKNAITEKEKSLYLKYAKEYASFCYLDDALRLLMTGYQEREGFHNTIFIITGDHSPFVRQMRGQINYRVPFLICSPMLKKPQLFHSVITHRDFTPTILAMLAEQFGMEVPCEAAWLNGSMDTSVHPHANTFSPFYSSDKKLAGLLYRENIFCDDILYEYDSAGDFVISNDENKTLYFQQLMSLYKTLDVYVFENNALLKPSGNMPSFNRLWLDVEDTISSDSYFHKKWGGSIVYDSIKSSDAFLFSGKDKSMEFFSFVIPDDLINIFKVEVEFDIYVENNPLNPSKIYVIHGFKKEKGRRMKDDITEETLNKWSRYEYAYTFDKDAASFKSGDKYTLYISNPNRLKGRIDDIKIRCVSN